MSDQENGLQSVIDTAQAATYPTELQPSESGLYSVVVPANGRHVTIDLEAHLPAPRRAKGSVDVQTVDDLVKYVKRHDSTEHTTLWVDLDGYKVVAVLNDHGADAPAWGDRRAQLQLKLTPEWLHWVRHDNQMMGQEAFAEHIEDGLLEIYQPDGATMLEIAQSIQGSTNAEFKQAKRLSNGQVEMQYVEKTTAAAGQRGDITIPERFVLGIAPFVGEDAVQIEARLRYRLSGGNVELGYKLDRPHEVIRKSIDNVANQLNEEFTGDRVFIGKPRA